jgi:hypothetical protein
VSVDTLRPPPLFDVTAAAYKDWLHLNVFDHDSGCIGIFNASLHGSPTDERSRAIGTALVHVPDLGWVGNTEVVSLGDADVGTTSIGLERVALATDPGARSVLASVRLGADGLEAGITATAHARPIDVALHYPFGAGWIAWYAVPRLSVEGHIVAGGRRIDISAATAYHDHNWGRWHWGDDIGWKWGACSSPRGDTTIVVSRATDRSHGAAAGTMLVVDTAGARRTFSADAVRITYDGRLAGTARRLPGALAALHQDRVAPALPARIVVHASDGVDSIDTVIHSRAAAQLIAADPARRGYGFAHEMVGSFTAACRIGGHEHRADGLAVFEHVD